MQEKKGAKTYKKVSSVICSYISILLLSILIITSCSVDTPQRGEYSIRGRVVLKTDSTETGLKGVRITIDDSNFSTVTDNDGYYVLNHISGGQLGLTAELGELILIPDFSELKSYTGSYIDVKASSVNAIVSGANFTATETVTISQIQGKGHISPLVNKEVHEIEGVVTSVTQLRPHYKFDELDTDVTLKDQLISEDGFYMQMVTPDGDPLTSDGIYVSTRNPQGIYNESSWLESCKVKVTDTHGNSTTRLPQPGDIVKVSGTIREIRPINRFNESSDRLSRTQINATSVEYVGQKAGGITTDDCVLITYTEQTGKNADSWRKLNFNEPGLDQFKQACDLFESVEGMLVQVNDPIVVGTTYYNHTAVMADGGKKNGEYCETFSPKWMAPVVRENNYNAGLIHLYYEKRDVSTSLGALPQIGTVLTDDLGARVFRGCMDYSSEGTYIINPIRKDSEDTVNVDYSNVKFSRHDKYGFKLNNQPGSFYADNPNLAKLVTKDFPADSYQKILYSNPRNMTFSVPWNKEPLNSKSKYMSVAVFNLENYSDAGSKFSKKENVAKVICQSLQCPDLIYIVEMGDDKHEDFDTIIYDNQDSNWLQPTGYVSASENYTALIDHIKSEYHIEYDYRQIDPIEFDQAGAPGMNIRVGFMFRTDRIQAIDAGMLTNTYGAQIFEDIPGVVEDYQHELSLQNAIPYKNKYGEIDLTQSPGFVQHPDFYHSRIPLACKFIFKPTQEYFIGIACHLYAKGGDAPLYGIQQPPVFASEIRRGNQTKALHEYIEKLQSIDKNVKIIVAGDMNDFGFTTPLKLLTGEYGGGDQILYSMSDFMPENERFTYTFKGNLQQLDQIFVTQNLYAETVRIPGSWNQKVFIPHVDSLFSRINHIQISDHDPLAARINME